MEFTFLLLLGGLHEILCVKHKAWPGGASKLITVIINHPHRNILLARLKADTKVNERNPRLQESCLEIIFIHSSNRYLLSTY